MDSEKRFYVSSSGAIELKIKLSDARAGFHSGDCGADVERLMVLPYIAEQLNALDAETLADALAEYGGWSVGELTDHAQNKARILWLACADIAEEEEETLGGEQ